MYVQVNTKQMSNREKKIKIIHNPTSGTCLFCLFYPYNLKSKNCFKLFYIALY